MLNEQFNNHKIPTILNSYIYGKHNCDILLHEPSTKTFCSMKSAFVLESQLLFQFTPNLDQLFFIFY